MEEHDLEIMKKYPVDFVSFSYYSSSCVAKDDAGLKKTAANTNIDHLLYHQQVHL